MAHNLVRAAERKALLRQVIGHIRRGEIALLRLLKHGVGVNFHGIDHARGAPIAVLERFRSVDGTFLVLLQVLVVRKGKRLHRDEQRDQVADHAPRLAADELGEVGVFLLRHDRGARREGVGQGDEAELRRRPENDLLAQARQVHARHAAGIQKVKQEIAVGDGIERVRDHAREAERFGRHEAVKRVGGAGERCGPERVRVRGVVCRAQAIEVAIEHPHVREHMMGEEHRLRMLHVRIARQNDVEVLLRLRHERMTKLHVCSHQVARPLLCEQARVGADLVVAAATRVKARARIADF